MKKQKALFAFSADPVHYGHLDIIEKAAKEYEKVIVGIGENPEKKGRYIFSLKERIEFSKKATSHLKNVKTVSYKGLRADFIYEQDIDACVRGIRDEKDREYEELNSLVDKSHVPEIEYEFLEADPKLRHVSSTTAKAIAEAYGDLHEYVPLYVKHAMEAKIMGQYRIAVTGEVGSGKSFIAKEIKKTAEEKGIPACIIDFDKIAHEILGELKEPGYKKVRKEIAETFGKEVEAENGYIDRKVLGKIVFESPEKMEKLNNIMRLPIQVQMRQELTGKKGLIIFDAPTLAEAEAAYVSNNHAVLVSAGREIEKERLKKRSSLSEKQIEKMFANQYSYEEKKKKIEEFIEKDKCGKLWEIDNSKDSAPEGIKETLKDIIKTLDKYAELRYKSLWKRIGADGSPDEEYKRFLARYSEENRYHHGIEHIVNSLNEMENFRNELEDPDSFELAEIYHDFEYDIYSKFNEEKSAASLEKVCKNAFIESKKTEKAKKLVLSTKPGSALEENDEKFLHDQDYAILGKSENKFDEYNENIWKEFEASGVPKEVYEKHRLEFLENTLRKKRIYLTDFFHEKYEKQARKNLERAIKKLEGE